MSLTETCFCQPLVPAWRTNVVLSLIPGLLICSMCRSTFPCAVRSLHSFCTPHEASCLSRSPCPPFSPCQQRVTFPIIGESPFTPVYRYSRADLLRILRLTARQLAAWERAGLVAAAETFSFFDLLQIKKVRDLCARKVRPAVIRQSLEAMQKQVAGMENPLLEAGSFSTGHRIAFRPQGRVLEPIA